MNINNSQVDISNGKKFRASAYTTNANGDKHTSAKWGNLTASGTTVKQGRTISVDPRVIPLGTRVYIDFPAPFDYLDGHYIAEDTGNAIKGNKIDVYLDNYNVIVNFGVRTVTIVW